MVKLSAALALALLLSTAIRAQAPAAAVNLTGDWTFSFVGDHVMRTGLILQHEGTKLSGTMLLMGKEAPIDGEFVDGSFTLTVKAAMRDHEGNDTPLKLVGKLLEDGTLAGEIALANGKMQWTAERLRKRTGM